MRGILAILLILTASAVRAEDVEETQSGTPAVLEAMNGTQVRVFLQGLSDGKLTFQRYKAERILTVEASKVKSLTFNPRYDALAAQQLLSAGDYAGAIEAIAPMMGPYEAYMSIDNNLRTTYLSLIEAYLKTGNLEKTREMAEMLARTDDPEQVQRGKVYLALVDIEEERIDSAKALLNDVSSETARLYLQACIERAEGNQKKAIRTVAGVIIKHANDLEWLGPSELLCAYLYNDMLGPDSVITTNSPLNTARQVKNIYKGSSVAADAEKLWLKLGGAEREAELKKAKEERIAAEKAEKEERLRAQAEKAKQNQKADGADDASGTEGSAVNGSEPAATNVTTATETEMESE